MKVATGDRGQRYEVRATDGQGREFVVGWTDNPEGIKRLTDGINRHPVYANPKVFDRNICRMVGEEI